MAAAAIVGAAVVGAVASSSAAGAQADASTQAAGLAQEGTLASIAEQRRQYDQSREDFAPYRDMGATALGEYGALFGIGRNGLIPATRGEVGPDVPIYEDRRVQTGTTEPAFYENGRLVATGRRAELDYNREVDFSGPGGLELRQNPTYTTESFQTGFGPGDGGSGTAGTSQSMEEARERFQATPGYQFSVDEGIRALDRSAAAQGRLQGGGYGRDLVDYGIGMANQEFNTYADRLAGLAGMGQGATSATSTLGAGAANSISNSLMTGAQLQGNALQNAGTARASGYAGIGNAVNQGIQNYQYSNQQNTNTPSYGFSSTEAY